MPDSRSYPRWDSNPLSPASGGSQFPLDLRRESAASRLLEMRIRISPGVWMSVSYECCVLSDRSLCIGLITRPESRTECGVSECDLEASIRKKLWPTRGCCAIKNNPSKREATDPPVQQPGHWVRPLLYCAYGVSRGNFRLLWPCIMNVGWRERNQQDANYLMFIIKLLSQHVSGIIMPIIRRTRLCTTAYENKAVCASSLKV